MKWPTSPAKWSAKVSSPAAHRRRDHQQGAHRRQDRAALQRTRRPRARRLAAPCRVVEQSDQRRAEAALRAANPRGIRTAPRSSTPARRRNSFRSRRPAANAPKSSGTTDDIRRSPSSPACAHRIESPIRTLNSIPFIDWSPFFHTWELRGRYPRFFNHEKHGEEARKLFADAQKLLQKIVDEKLTRTRARLRLLPGQSRRR